MADRKKDHIELAFRSQIAKIDKENRFVYEPMLRAHPTELEPVEFLGKRMSAPVWISSMTGGTSMAKKINYNLAQLAHEFGLGMGLGSCRCLLESANCLSDFDVRSIIGDGLPLFANLGISQVESLLLENSAYKIEALIETLKADGLIVHVNPLQEFFQLEGDVLKNPPITIIDELLKVVDCKIIVKEVGQGMGYESLKALLKLPIAAIDYGAFGGTNFSKLELLRNNDSLIKSIGGLAKVGQTAEEMTNDMNRLFDEFPEQQNREVIISGGIKTFLDGYYLINKIKHKAIYGQGSTFLAYAMEDYQTLKMFFEYQIKGLQMANAYLRVV
jgi:isopentenyl-diphosphate Delta-isomerase